MVIIIKTHFCYNKSNIFLLFYFQDLKKIVADVGKFLNKSLTEDEIRAICDNSSFDNMKKTPTANPDPLIQPHKKEEGKKINFMRKGRNEIFTNCSLKRLSDFYWVIKHQRRISMYNLLVMNL